MEDRIKKLQNWFLHIDLDAFYASVEQLDNPDFRGKPVIVGGHKDDKRGVVSTASYEARKYGVHSAMPIFKALKLCPNGIYVRPRMKRYAELSYQIMNIFRNFSPDVEQMSIDEAFVDLTGTEDLFGPPEETALKIKEKVKEMTGLTVSVGLATTKYLAKIASGYSKPNGFCFIKPEDGQNFMLSLPLTKVWGVGPKALERLKKAGILTTKDIYEKPLDLLVFLFGNSMGTFLYNVVRGEEKDSFTKKRKSHSISAEKTFPIDITDIYTAETELMELAQTVMFRLLREEKFSRTVTVKIKYDDFTSVTIQKTLDRNIITLDTFFDNIKKLFEEKYQQGKGIRLLGAGFDKVESNDKPYQQSLFETNEDKKQAVEKAILNLNKKHPEIKIQKARLLKSVAILFLLISQLLPCFKSNIKLYAEDNHNEEITSEENISDNTIFNWDINDVDKVDFSISGSWQVDVSGKFINTFGKNIPYSFNPTIPVLKQDINLSSLFTLDRKWYFQADFADNFSNNTLAMGYNGNKYFRSGKFSNRNITMPNTYSAETFGFGLSGGKNQAPGISAHWQSPSDKWSADLLLRYDMTKQNSATFYGMNKIKEKVIEPEKYLYGYSYTFPENSKSELLEIKDIYVESSSDGKFIDIYGKKYNKLSSTDYIYNKKNNILFLSPNCGGNKIGNNIPTILVTFLSKDSVSKIIDEAGDYNKKESFLGKIQNYFGNKYKLQDYTYPLKSNIENQDALIIQNTTGFSPFIIANTYDCGTESINDISVISKSSSEITDLYIAEIENNLSTLPHEDFLNKKHIYAKISNKDYQFNQFPFANKNPEIYLNLKSESDIAIQTKIFNTVSEINIGQNIPAGSIIIYRNGALEQNFIYDTNTGNITLSSPINNTDQINVIWQEEASNFAKGNFALGMGFQLNILNNLNWDISLTGQKPVTFDKSIPTPDNIQNSFIALTTGINYSLNDFKASDKATFSIQKQNDSDKVLVSSQNKELPKEHYLNYNSGFVTEVTPSLPDKILKEINNCTINSHEGIKYENGNYKIPLSWNFSNNSTGENWAAVDIKLNKGEKLKNSSLFNFKLQIKNNLPSNSLKFYLQLGIKAGNNNLENNIYIPTYDITNQINLTNKNWQNIEISLTDKDRAFLVSDCDARIIIVQTSTISSGNSEGTIYIGSYTPKIQSIFTEADENIMISTTSVPVSENNVSSEIFWNIPDPKIINNYVITATTNFTPCDFSQYKTISFNFAYKKITEQESLQNPVSTPSAFTFSLDKGNLLTTNFADVALKLEIKDLTDYISDISDELHYHTVKINTKDNSLYIDGNKIEKTNYKLDINNNIVPSRAKYEINTKYGNKPITTSGKFYISNILVEDTELSYSFQNKVSAEYKKDNIININDFALLSNGFISVNSTQKISDNDFSILSSLFAGINIAGFDIKTDYLFSNVNLLNGGYSISNTTPLIDIFTYESQYRWNRTGKTLNKENNFNLDLSKFNIPITLQSSLSASDDISSKNQNHKTLISSNFKIKNNSFKIESYLNTNQQINLQKNQSLITEKNNYFKNWLDISELQFSTGEKLASSRKSIFANNFSGIINLTNFSISPSVDYILSSVYEDTTKSELTDITTINLLLPFTFNNNYLSFSLSKNISGITEETQNGNYFSDLDNLFESQAKRKYFYTSIPFYDLFDQNYSDKLNGNYSAKYEITYKRPLSNSFKDLFIPSTAILAFARDIKSNDDNNFSDIYQIKSTITNKSINNFGNTSEKKFFSWFDQEELMSGITLIFKIPADIPENLTYKITNYIQLFLWLNQSSAVNTFFDFSFETNNTWNLGGTFVYTRPGKTSFIGTIINCFIEDSKKLNFKIDRKDSLVFNIGTVNNRHMEQYDYNHSLDMGFLNNFTLSTGIGCAFTYVENKSISIALNYNLGGKIIF